VELKAIGLKTAKVIVEQPRPVDRPGCLHAVFESELNRIGAVDTANFRDRWMAENLVWLATERYPNQKIVCWAATAHQAHGLDAIRRGGQPMYEGVTMAGVHAKKALGNKMHTIGFVAHGGWAGLFANLRYVIVDEQQDFDSWLDGQPTWEEIQSIPPGDPAAGKAAYATCASCHGQRGEGNIDMNAPRLAGLEDWYIERQLRHYQQGIRGAHEEDEYGQQMAPMANTLASDSAIRNVTAYIETLQPEEVTNTLDGNPKKGAAHYVTCGACHGSSAQGNYALQAPRLAGQNDWYLKRQLRNFRKGIRGTHEEDDYGHQMVLMARSLQNEKAIDDLLAYVETL